ncbi:MAG: methyltransferase domain-containing protein [Syntrophobacteraceae bacterium]|jgi:ubiquinone/menaquinone biosynthesis C-methylase UbiE
MEETYVHGYDSRESVRLQDQASTLSDLLHSDTSFPAGSRVLEAGCGVGAQTSILARNSPGAEIIAIDVSEASLAQAKKKLDSAGITNVSLKQGDIFELPFEKASFDHVFVCFVLEHLPNPVEALKCLKKMIKAGGTITVIEGDHGSVYFYPESQDARRAINCQIALQARAGGNALIGRELYPLLTKAGFRNCRVSPRMVYVDSSRPHFVEGFTKNTFTAMIEGVREKAPAAGIIDRESFDRGIRDLYRTTEPDGVFCYTFFKATAIR